MPFEHGSVSFRMLKLPRKLPEDAIERFAGHAAPPIDTLGEGAVRGWVTGRHLLDRNITKETAYFGGYLRLTLQSAERKIPASLLRAECKMEELALMAAEDKPFVTSRERSEIKKSVISRLLPKMPPQLKGTDFVHETGSRYLFATCTSVKMADEFTSSFQSALGFTAYPLTPDFAAQELKANTAALHPANFSPDMPDDTTDLQIGREFLTWLWFASEKHADGIPVPTGEQVAVLVEGPVTFIHEGNGAHETTLRKGMPMNSAEAKTALLCGKKLKEAKITLAIGDDFWVFKLNADEFTFRSLALSKPEEMLDQVSLFQDRMLKIERLRELFMGLFEVYIKDRSHPETWHKTLKAIRAWVKERIAQK
ncbi:MAG: hypothetical protein EOM20_12110 [Spartobacteria bacterium]|nr:hypothetical protein [Spartobacteria bacterium]